MVVLLIPVFTKPILSVCVRVLSLWSLWFCDRALTLPSCSVFMWVRGFECAWAVCSLVCVPCFVLERVVRIPALMSWLSVSWLGSDTRAPCYVLLCECAVSSSLGHTLFWPRVLCCCTQFVFLSAVCIHVLSCAEWHAACVFHWLRAFMLSCLVAYEYSH